MSKKKKNKKIILPLPVSQKNLFCGFPLIQKNINQLWDWKTLENIN